MSFDTSPFADRLFAQMCIEHGCHDKGSGWKRMACSAAGHGDCQVEWPSIGSDGIGNDGICGLPKGLPIFRYGHDDGRAFLSVCFGPATYVRRASVRTVHIATQLPETVILGATGRPLHHVVNLPGLHEDRIVMASAEKTALRSEVTILLEEEA